MQECVTEDTECQGEVMSLKASFSLARAALAACLDLVGGDQTASGVLGAAAASLAAVELARCVWRRYHPSGADFPPDR